MNKKLSIICLAIFTNCFAQTVSLETMAQCEFGACPPATYVKDVNNLLNKYVGTWKGMLDDKNYEFNFIKRENFGFEDSLKKDRLIGRLKITSSNGVIEYDNFSQPDDKTSFYGHNLQPDLKAYMARFSGGKLGCIDYGYVYLRIKPETPNNMTVIFLPDNDIATEDCTNFKTTIPTKKNIYLTKQ
ncbi:DUF6705 family protein [Chryseobacterium oryctis]|uniref:DUF6705 domain-containing protein n=1 Tax=Chryseobacterium oryctis TaxID=2952618 RepID=A0ABT3HPF8_9FLAO|nr:DUF6705 family protein [Chryseobacterium oryctis]MCW3161575.1 hypothetical protein [Chryseobacterium oryctis]